MIQCPCVERHVPLPTRYKSIKVDGAVVNLCPTTYENVLDLLTAYRVYETVPPGKITKHYSKFVRQVSYSLWKESRV